MQRIGGTSANFSLPAQSGKSRSRARQALSAKHNGLRRASPQAARPLPASPSCSKRSCLYPGANSRRVDLESVTLVAAACVNRADHRVALVGGKRPRISTHGSFRRGAFLALALVTVTLTSSSGTRWKRRRSAALNSFALTLRTVTRLGINCLLPKRADSLACSEPRPRSSYAMPTLWVPFASVTSTRFPN